jgi:hypothetical protein
MAALTMNSVSIQSVRVLPNFFCPIRTSQMKQTHRVMSMPFLPRPALLTNPEAVSPVATVGGVTVVAGVVVVDVIDFRAVSCRNVLKSNQELANNRIHW